jgi:sulfite dehydrogenase
MNCRERTQAGQTGNPKSEIRNPTRCDGATARREQNPKEPMGRMGKLERKFCGCTTRFNLLEAFGFRTLLRPGTNILTGKMRGETSASTWSFGFLCGFFLLVAPAARAGALKIELPPETGFFKPGPGSEVANGQCLVCHSVEYVLMQPPSGRTYWAAAVKKMRDKFGAQVPEQQVESLVAYLSKSYGTETNAATAGQNPGSTPESSPVPATATDGETLANHYGCLLCHNVNVKIGPHYKDIAAKYAKDSDAFAKIAQQIHQGGSGKWGPVIMPPFPMVTEAETKALADWILSRK